MQEVQAKRFDAREGPRSPSPTDCWQWFNIRTHNCLKPVTTGHQELADFFRALVKHSSAASMLFILGSGYGEAGEHLHYLGVGGAVNKSLVYE